MDFALAMVAALLLALVAFRRARDVLTPEARRTAARRSSRSRRRRAALALLAFIRAAVGVVALVAIVWLATQLFT